MALLDKDSCLCVNSELDYFNIPPTNTSSIKTFYSKVYPINALDQGGPIEFSVVGNKTDFIDLFESYIKIKAKILKQDNSAPQAPNQDGNIPAVSKVFPVNYLSGAIFKDVLAYIDGKCISGTNNLYPYKALFELLLSYEKDILKQQGALGLYFNDKDDLNATDPTTDQDSGRYKRFQKTQYGKEFEIFGKIHCDLFSQKRKLPGDIPLIIKCIKNEDKFLIMSGHATQKYKIRIDEAILYLKRYRLIDNFINELDKMRSQHLMKFPMKRIFMKYTTHGPNQTLLQNLNLLSNEEIPKRLIFALIDSRGFEGSYAHNPFNFQNFNVTNIKVKKGEDPIPFQEIKLNYANDLYNEAYWCLLHGTGRLFKNNSLSYESDEFKSSGKTIYCLDLSKNGCDFDTFELNETGSIHVEVQLDAAVTHGITIVFYFEYDSILALGDNNSTQIAGGI